MSKNHQTQSIRKSSLHKLLFGYVQTLVTQCSYITINTYESIVSIIKLYNLAKLWKCKKYTIQFFKVNPLFTACFGSSFQMDSPNPWKWKNLNHLKKNSEDQKVFQSWDLARHGNGHHGICNKKVCFLL